MNLESKPARKKLDFSNAEFEEFCSDLRAALRSELLPRVFCERLAKNLSDCGVEVK